jgi:hypothetical protein
MNAHVVVGIRFEITRALQPDRETRRRGAHLEVMDLELIALCHWSHEGIPEPKVRRLREPRLIQVILFVALALPIRKSRRSRR